MCCIIATSLSTTAHIASHYRPEGSTSDSDQHTRRERQQENSPHVRASLQRTMLNAPIRSGHRLTGGLCLQGSPAHIRQYGRSAASILVAHMCRKGYPLRYSDPSESGPAPYFSPRNVAPVGLEHADGRSERLSPHRCTEVDTPLCRYGRVVCLVGGRGQGCCDCCLDVVSRLLWRSISRRRGRLRHASLAVGCRRCVHRRQTSKPSRPPIRSGLRR
jgi:hypothetical protein